MWPTGVIPGHPQIDLFCKTHESPGEFRIEPRRIYWATLSTQTGWSRENEGEAKIEYLKNIIIIYSTPPPTH